MRWVSESLTIKHKTDRKAISSELLARFEAKGGAFLPQIVTADETLVHYFEPETERSRTRNGIDGAHVHLFLVGARL
jgi:hypothetical protein